jgi:hypothetical protein
VTETRSAEKAKLIARELLTPKGVAFPVLSILLLPALLWLWLASPHSFSNYLTVLWWTLEWASLPGNGLLHQIAPSITWTTRSLTILASYIVPLGLLGTVVVFVLIQRAVPKYRAVWLGFAWSVFSLQLLGTIPMAYLWAMGA